MWRYGTQLKRISDNPAIGHEHIPNSHAQLQNVDVRINDLGLRGAELRTPKPAHRIAVIGDSLAFGWGVPEDQTLAQQLQKQYNAKFGANAPYEVVNAGVGNMNLSQIVAHWEKMAVKIPVDELIVLVSLRAPAIQPPASTNIFLEHSMLAALVSSFMQQADLNISGRDELVRAYKKNWTGGKGYADMLAAFAKLKQMEKEKGYKITLVMIPETNSFSPYSFSFMTETTRKIAQQYHWAFYDALQAIKHKPAPSWWATSQDVHLNGAAFAAIAEGLFPILEPHE
jgi:lysophospholipase L1-like esterase